MDRLVDEVAAHERDLESLKTQAEAMRVARGEEKQSIAMAHAAALAAAAAEHKAAVEQLSSDLAAAKVCQEYPDPRRLARQLFLHHVAQSDSRILMLVAIQQRQ